MSGERDSVVIIALDNNERLSEILDKLDRQILIMTNSRRKIEEVVEAMLERRGETNER